jgi:glyoxylase-like metal-dependent hydrolase (beta-lactamase superfamily II)
MTRLHSTRFAPLLRSAAAWLASSLALFSCSQSYHPVVRSELGSLSTWERVEQLADEPGPIVFEKHVAADWKIDRSGLLNLDHRRARHLRDEPEDIQVYLYSLEHPRFGRFVIDSGIAHAFVEAGAELPVRWPISAVMPMDTLQVRLDTRTFLASLSRPLSGVFLTHLHLDHVLGLTDIPHDVPLFVGPGEADDSRWLHLVNRPTTNANLDGFGPLRQWTVSRPGQGELGVVDVFGDQSLFGLHVPGHTRGNMAFLVRSVDGPQLLTADSCHTAFGWEHGVEPGTFNTDGEQAAESLRTLRAFAARHPALTIHLGHQPGPPHPQPSGAAATSGL